MKTGIELIAEERNRQIEKEGWNNLHDEDHDSMQLSGAAGCYVANAINKFYEEDIRRHGQKARFQYNFEAELNFLVNSGDRGDRQVSKGGWRDGWPWENEWDKRKKHDKTRSLVIAGALIAAEIDRLNKVSNPATEDPQSDTDWKQKYLEAQAKVEFYRETTDKVRELVSSSNDIGKPCQPLYDAIVDKINSQQSELTALRGTIEYWKLRLSECENIDQQKGREG